MVVAPSTNALRRQQLALSELEELAKRIGALRKGVLQAEGLSPGLSVQASLPRVTAYHRSVLLTAGAASFFLGSGTNTQRRLQALGQVLAFCRQAGMLEDCQGVATLLLYRYTGALPGHRYTEAITTVLAL